MIPSYKTLGYNSYLIRSLKLADLGNDLPVETDSQDLTYSDLGFDYNHYNTSLNLPTFSSDFNLPSLSYAEVKNIIPTGALSWSKLSQYMGQGLEFWKWIDDEVGVAGTNETDWLSPTNNYTTSGTGNYAWTTPGNCYSDDGNFAVTGTQPYWTFKLKCFGFDVSSVPAGATINGIQIKTDCYRENTLILPQTSLTFAISNSNEIGTTGFTPNANCVYLNKDWPVSEDTITLGDSADVWGKTGDLLAYIQNAYFGVEIQCYSYYPNVMYYIDWVRIKIYYTPA